MALRVKTQTQTLLSRELLFATQTRMFSLSSVDAEHLKTLAGQPIQLLSREDSTVQRLVNSLTRAFDLTDYNMPEARVTIYRPGLENNTLVNQVEPAEILTGCRLIMSLNTPELFTFETAFQRNSASTEVRMPSDTVMMMPIGVCASTRISFDQRTYVQYVPRVNYRKQVMKKDPSKRFVMIVDYIIQDDKSLNLLLAKINAPKASVATIKDKILQAMQKSASKES